MLRSDEFKRALRHFTEVLLTNQDTVFQSEGQLFSYQVPTPSCMLFEERACTGHLLCFIAAAFQLALQAIDSPSESAEETRSTAAQ